MNKALMYLAEAEMLMSTGKRRFKQVKLRDGKSLSDYRVPPRSMTEAEKAHYDQHKNLNNFYK